MSRDHIFSRMSERYLDLPEWLRYFVIYAVLFVVYYLAFMAGWQVYVTGDSLGFNYPALKALEPFSVPSLITDPFSGRGFPWMTAYGTFDPIAHLLRMAVPEYQLLAWLCFLYHVLAAVFFALFLRRSGRTPTASFVGGFIFVGAFFWVADGDYALAFSPLLLATMLYVSERYMHRHTLFLFLTASLVFYGWMAGHFNFVPIIIIGVGAYVLYKQWIKTKGHTIGAAFSTWPYVIGVVLGTAGASIKLVPALAMVELSERTGGLSAAAAGASSLRLSFLFTALFPYVRLPYLPGEIGGTFYGAFALALLLLVILRHPKKWPPALWAFLLCVLIALPHSPLYWLIQHIPFLSYLRNPVRWMLLGHAAAACTIAIGCDMLLKRSASLRIVFVGRLFLALSAVTLFGSCVLLIINRFFRDDILGYAKTYFTDHLYAQTSGLPLEHYLRHIDGMWEQTLRSVGLFSPLYFLSFLFVCATGFLLLRISSIKKHLSSIVAPFAIVTVFPFFFPYHVRGTTDDIESIAALYRTRIATGSLVMPVMPALADYVVRTSAYDDVPEESLLYKSALLIPNTHALTGVHSIDFYQPIQPRRMARLLAALGSDVAPAPSPERLSQSSLSLEEKINVITHRISLLQLLTVSTVVSAWELPSPFIFSSSFRPVERLPEIRLYDIPDTKPIAYVPTNPIVIQPDEDAAISLLTSTGGDVRPVIECVRCDASISSGDISIRTVSRTDVESVFHVMSSVDTMIIISMPRYIGWRVFVDDKATRTAIANGFFFAVPISAGEHDVKLTVNFPQVWGDSFSFLATRRDRWQL